MPGGKGAATLRRPGLIQQWRSLWRRFGKVNAVDKIMTSPVPDRMNLCGIGKDSRVAIAADRIVFPASFPQFVTGLEEILRRIIALVMHARGGEPHAARPAGEIAGDDMPADPPIGEMIEC